MTQAPPQSTLSAPRIIDVSRAAATATAATGAASPNGRSFPIGATVVDGGVNFCVFSRHATAMEVLLFDRDDDQRPARTVRMDPVENRTYHYWHTFVSGLRAGQLYAYRASGPREPTHGLRFDSSKVLLDPYGRGVAVPRGYSRDDAKRIGHDNCATAMKSVVIDPSAYDWEGDAPPRRPAARTIIYEMHVGGFTRHPSAGIPEKTRGTYAGLIEKIPYLKDLGITAVELLPVFQFDALDCPPGVINYWGYQPVSFFAPHQAYSSRQDPHGPYAAVIPRWCAALLAGEAPRLEGDGATTRDFTPVEAVVRANLLAATRPELEPMAVLNVGTGRETRLDTLFAHLRELVLELGRGRAGMLPSPAPARPGDRRASRADLSRARGELGYEPPEDLVPALRATLRELVDSSAGAS